MSAENQALVRRYFEEVWNKQNLEAIDELVSADQIDHTLQPGLPPGREGAKVFVRMYLGAFPDTKITIDDMIAEGDKVVTRWTATGTHTGELMGIPATGKRIAVMGISIDRFSGGKEVETWGVFDQLGMMQQLGVVPMPGQRRLSAPSIEPLELVGQTSSSWPFGSHTISEERAQLQQPPDCDWLFNEIRWSNTAAAVRRNTMAVTIQSAPAPTTALQVVLYPVPSPSGVIG